MKKPVKVTARIKGSLKRYSENVYSTGILELIPYRVDKLGNTWMHSTLNNAGFKDGDVVEIKLIKRMGNKNEK